MTWEAVDVATAQPYQVLIGRGAPKLLPQFLEGVDRVAVFHPPTLAHWIPELIAGLDQQVLTIEVPDSEAAKTAEVLARCWEQLAEAGFTRSDAVVGFGGGTTTDLAGFVAATWLRGVRYIALPTTLLGMVDAAVGGKTGINLSAGKNLAGAFFEPFTVICDLVYLTTLPEVDTRAGMAEVLKCGFIVDPQILQAFSEDPKSALQAGSDLQWELIRRAIAVKAQAVAGDLTERTSQDDRVGREILNYGHTLGHAIEAREHFSRRHGEAVAIGMVFAAELSARMGLIEAELVAEHRRVLSLCGLPISYPGGNWTALREAMNLDKKTRGSTLRFVVLTGLGRVRMLVDPPEAELIDSYNALVEA
ncbi:3-dehydroquinate synthase [Propionicimonas sp.]|uniref:3-dehydroquinate synthase n=1 Tax=Propionicimonas sp. TaxID=1955623 RepID=UPI0017F16D4F|nr:3-dehydroquinate synthase [Propionicimonas sp.]MBU3977375.1 3-dehydroquinate synthase [Actinomycetota bacterium]MBA3021299.1 3-dehydroquinate synthase [Propionicimonas sp.]MBU3985885.1 3-dehydroquinate synthase [Actinomycetota bacterium]MBU4008670.1 3-dehydroquinate synthase [Actinomycetota bacterium]MBU4066180.1 3-dehydroquinate synthase [Actinomycetota bacterium]